MVRHRAGSREEEDVQILEAGGDKTVEKVGNPGQNY
jgi:hypothetical protein